MRRCAGAEGGYGVVVGPREPVVFEFPPKPCPMLITEQPTRSIDFLKKGIDNENLKGIAATLNDLLEGNFYEAIKNKKIYWTHYVKCPGRLRGPRKGGPFIESACAGKFLGNEIEDLKPPVIVAAGGRASASVLAMGGLNVDWREQLWEEIRTMASGRPQDFEAPIASGARLLVLMHPSSANPLGYFLPKLRPLLKTYLPFA